MVVNTYINRNTEMFMTLNENIRLHEGVTEVPYSCQGLSFRLSVVDQSMKSLAVPSYYNVPCQRAPFTNAGILIRDRDSKLDRETLTKKTIKVRPVIITHFYTCHVNIGIDSAEQIKLFTCHFIQY